MRQIAPLFEGWEETMVWACLQGVMGRALASGSGRSAVIVQRDFCFFAGEPDSALVRQVEGPILVPRTEDWHPVIEEALGDRAVRESRYAIRKEPGVFDREKLAALAAALPAGYEMRQIDETLVPALLAEEWSRDLCAPPDSPAGYRQRGLGFAALHGGVPAAGAGSYCVYEGGIEIEIDTRRDHRRRGLAAACGARLILACLDRGLYPSWDAIDLRSVSLAEKLGYHRAEPYPIYWLGEK